MIKLPFVAQTFARDMKPKISANNLSLEYANLESTLSKVATELRKYLGAEVYDKICEGTAATGADVVSLNSSAKDHLQRAMLHFAIYHHVIYLIANIGNDGITVKKTDDTTTIYKYLQDDLRGQLISDAWFWLNELVELLNSNTAKFLDWKDSAAKKEIDSMPLKIQDLEKYVGVSALVFMMYAGWIIREVYSECILSRQKADATISDKMKRAFCYEVMGRSCQRLAYHCLPEPIRLEINSEMSKNHSQAADSLIREKVADIFLVKSNSYWNSVDVERATMTQRPEGVSAATYQSQVTDCENKKFVHS